MNSDINLRPQIFRAESWKTKELVIGQLLQVPSYNGYTDYIITYVPCVSGDKVYMKEKRTRVIPFTVQQCTCIKDSDGKDIYEYDSVDVKYPGSSTVHVYFVEYDPTICSWMFNEGYRSYMTLATILSRKPEYIRIRKNENTSTNNHN